MEITADSTGRSINVLTLIVLNFVLLQSVFLHAINLRLRLRSRRRYIQSGVYDILLSSVHLGHFYGGGLRLAVHYLEDKYPVLDLERGGRELRRSYRM